MGLFLFIDGPVLVCGWVNFPILWPHTPVQMKLKCPPPPGYGLSLSQSDQRICSVFQSVYNDKYMLPRRICKYSAGKSMTEILNDVENAKFIEIKGVMKPRGRKFDEKISPCSRDLTIFENVPPRFLEGMIMLGIDQDIRNLIFAAMVTNLAKPKKSPTSV